MLYRRFGSQHDLFMAPMQIRTSYCKGKFVVDTTPPPAGAPPRLGMRVAPSFFKPDYLEFLHLVVSGLSHVDGLPG